MTPDVGVPEDIELIEGGYLYLARAFFESRIWVGLKSTHITVALACLFLAVWKDTTVMVGETEITLKRGQFWFTQDGLAKRCPKDVTRRVIRRALRNLQDKKFLTLEAVHAAVHGAVQVCTVGTIINYKRYQDPRLYAGQAAVHAAGQYKKEVIKNTLAFISSTPDFLPWAKDLVNEWNKAVARSPATQKISAVIWDEHGKLPLGDGRLVHLVARYREPMFVLNRDKIFSGILKSPLLSGRLLGTRTGKYRNFRASFDWLIANADNYRFVLEGRYDDAGQADKPRGLRTTGTKYAGIGIKKGESDNDKLF